MNGLANRVVGYVWPKITRCPSCGSTEWEDAGASREGTVRYRRCANLDKPECPNRSTPYKILPIAKHVDRGGEQSEVEPY